MQLRDYQNQCQDAVKTAFANGINRQLIALPTGTGKTVIFAYLPQKLEVRKAIILAHREELIDQAAEKIRQVNPDLNVQIEQGDRHASPMLSDIVVASVPTIGRENSSRLRNFDPNAWPLIVCDEAHHSVSNSYRTVFNHFGIFDHPERLLVGVTATPNRGDKIGLSEVYQDIVFQRNLRDMIEAKWLCPITAFRIKTGEDLSEVRVSHGDFVDADLSKAIDTDRRNALGVEAYKNYCEGRRCLVFCVDKNHTRHMAEAFEAAGIPCGVVLGDTDSIERKRTLDALERGDLKVIANCMVLTEGYDCPPLSSIIMARPTKSGLLYTQCVGRGTRLAEGKENLIVIDLTDNSRQHQLSSLPSLFGLPADFELKGDSVTETLETIEDLAKQYPFLPLHTAASIQDVHKLIEKFDILKNTQLDSNVSSYSRFTWVKSTEGYSLFLKSEDKSKINITEDLLGKFEVSILQNGLRGSSRIMTCDTLEQAFHAGDNYLAENYQDKLILYKQDAKWRDYLASDKQKQLMTKLGVLFPGDITKGQASLLISNTLAKAKR